MGRRTIVHALHGPEATSELAMLGTCKAVHVYRDVIAEQFPHR
jgi:hypothetical protein